MTTNYKIFNNTVFALAIALLCYYIVTFFMMPPIIHPEFYRTFPAMLAETEQGLFHDAISKTFNLLMIEDGAYRPRALAFFMHWIDTHTIAALSQYTTLFGVRLPLILFSALTFVAMAFLLCRALFPSFSISLCLLLSTLPLFFPQFQITTYVTLRSAKMLAPAVIAFIFYIFIKFNHNMENSKKSHVLLIAFLLFLLSTIDEQSLATLVFFTSLSLLLCLLDKKINVNFIIFIIATLSYLVYHLFLAKMLFKYFTPVDIGQHPHTIGGVLRIDMSMMHNSLSLLYKNMRHFFPPIVCAIIFMLVFYKLVTCYKRFLLRECIVFASILLFIITLIYSICIAHPSIVALPDLHKSMYFIPTVSLLYFAILYIFSRIVEFEKLKPINAAILLIVVTISHVIYFYNYKSDYYLNHVAKNGHLRIVSSKNDPGYPHSFVDILDGMNIQGYVLTSW